MDKKKLARREQLYISRRTILDALEADDRSPTNEERTRVEAMNAEILQIDRALGLADGVPSDFPPGDSLTPLDDATPTASAADGITRAARGRRFAEVFPEIQPTMGGFDNAEEFFAAVLSNRFDSRLSRVRVGSPFRRSSFRPSWIDRSPVRSSDRGRDNFRCEAM